MKLGDQKFLILGGSGLLGNDLINETSRVVPESNLLVPNSKTLDFTDPRAVTAYFNKFRPTVVLNAAAYTHVDEAETNREKAYLVNAIGPKHLAASCREFGAKLVHFSTDYVFSGEHGRKWREDDTPCPPKPNYYAQTKLDGEKYVSEFQNAVILRVQWLYGKKRDRFSSFKEKKTFTPFIDQWGAPCWTREIAKVVLELLERDARGLFHFAYDDAANWLEVYQWLKERWGLKTELLPKRLNEVPLPAKRPANCVMSNEKLCRALGRGSLGSWKRPFIEFLESR